jgi:hypothetical protein
LAANCVRTSVTTLTEAGISQVKWSLLLVMLRKKRKKRAEYLRFKGRERRG